MPVTMRLNEVEVSTAYKKLKIVSSFLAAWTKILFATPTPFLNEGFSFRIVDTYDTDFTLFSNIYVRN